MSEYKTATEKRKHIRRMAIIITAIVLTVLVFFFIVRFVFVVEDVSVAGAEGYDREELLSVAGIKYGKSIFSVSESRVRKRLTEKYPYIKNVDIYKEYPGYIVLTVSEEHTTFYAELEGEYFLFNYIKHEVKLLSHSLMSEYPYALRVGFKYMKQRIHGAVCHYTVFRKLVVADIVKLTALRFFISVFVTALNFD